MYSKSHKLYRVTSLKPRIMRSKIAICNYSSGTGTSTHGPTDTTGFEVGKEAGARPNPETSFDRRNGMKSWEIRSYNGPSSLQLVNNVKIPILQKPSELLIKIKAASINPIDVEMTRGYGSKVLGVIRTLERGKLPRLNLDRSSTSTLEFPITLGRDFSGVVVEAGVGVRDIRVGDEVYGVLGFTENGTHAEYTVANRELIQKKPAHLTHTEAASIPYVGLTTWSAVKITGNFCNLENKKFLVLGGSGGVGTLAIQYLKSGGAQVYTTCNADAVPLLEILGVNSVIDYTSPDCQDRLDSFSPYDCILNVAGPKNDSERYLPLLKPMCGQYITLSPPALSNFDRHGFIGGAVKNAVDLIKANVNSLTRTRNVTKWAFFVPTALGFRDISSLVAQKRIQPVVDKIYKFSEMPEAYEKVDGGHLRGKIVADFD